MNKYLVLIHKGSEVEGFVVEAESKELVIDTLGESEGTGVFSFEVRDIKPETLDSLIEKLKNL